MYDAEVVCDADRREQLLEEVDRDVDAEAAVLVKPRPHGASLDPLHDDEQHRTVLVEVVHAHDARVVERGHCRRLAVEALAKVRVARVLLGQDLDGHRDLEAWVRRAVDDAHRAPAKFRLDRVFPELRRGH